MAIFTWVIQGLLALMFITAGFGKVAGSKMHIENFKKWRYPQWFRVVTGLIELAAAILLVIGYWYKETAIVGATLLIAVGIGGVFTHIRAKDTWKEASLIAILGILAIILFIVLYNG